jgi:hypothetical protein
VNNEQPSSPSLPAIFHSDKPDDEMLPIFASEFRHMFIRVLKNIAVLSFLAIFLAGGSGITLFIHTCGSSHQRDVYAFREILHQDIGCCCTEDAGMPPNTGTSREVADDDCCRIAHLFIKAPYAGFPVVENAVAVVPVFDLPQHFILNNYSEEDSKASFIPFLDHSPPPLSGVERILLLHQLRIPAPAC